MRDHRSPRVEIVRSRESGSRLGRGVARVGLLLVVAVATTGCVASVAEVRKLERQVRDLQRDRSAGDARQRVADLSAEVDELRSMMRELQGQLDETRRLAAESLVEARKARREAVASAGGGADRGESTPGGSTTEASEGVPEDASGESPGESPSAEVQAYQEGLSAWRHEDYSSCIDRFRSFLQTYASSSRADDAAFWMADCHYKQGEFKNAVLRFDDVVRNYPDGNRAPDALYRQGEALLKLGPGFREAAKRAFERVLKEYPESARDPEARRQRELHGSG